MDKHLSVFEAIVRKAHQFTEIDSRETGPKHPFETRNVHQALHDIVQNLFDNGHYAQATFEAFKYLDRQVAHIANSNLTGRKLMMEVFRDQSPAIQLTTLSNDSEKDEQEGYRFIFAGSIMAIRNPRGHEYHIKDSLDDCLDHLSLASLLLRRVEKSGYKLE